MRSLLILVLAMANCFSFADTLAIEDLLYDGSDNIHEINLTTEKTRTEYREIRVPSTCYRTEYRQICDGSTWDCRRICDPRRRRCRRRCRSGNRICRTVPIVVSYRCIIRERRRVEVHDYNVETKATFEFIAPEQPDLIREAFRLKLRGDKEALSVTSSKNYFLILDHRSREEKMGAGTKYIDLTYKIRLASAREVAHVLGEGIRNVSLRRGLLNFTLGANFNLDDFVQRLRLYKNRPLGPDSLIIERYLNPKEVYIQSDAYNSYVTIDLKKLGVILPKRLRVVLNSSYKIDQSKILNKNDVKMEASTNWIFK